MEELFEGLGGDFDEVAFSRESGEAGPLRVSAEEGVHEVAELVQVGDDVGVLHEAGVPPRRRRPVVGGPSIKIFGLGEVADEGGLGEEALLADTVTESAEETTDLMPAVLASLETGSVAFEVLTSEVRTLRERVVTAERERDEALAMTQRALTQTASILDTLAATPVGRRAVVRQVSTEFENLSGVYSEEFLKMLRG